MAAEEGVARQQRRKGVELACPLHGAAASQIKEQMMLLLLDIAQPEDGDADRIAPAEQDGMLLRLLAARKRKHFVDLLWDRGLFDVLCDIQAIAVQGEVRAGSGKRHREFPVQRADLPHRLHPVEAVQIDVHKNQVKPPRLPGRQEILAPFKNRDAGGDAAGSNQPAKLLTVRPVILADGDEKLFHVPHLAFFVQYQGKHKKADLSSTDFEPNAQLRAELVLTKKFFRCYDKKVKV